MNIPHHRLHNQHITQPTFTHPADLLSWLVGIQGQDYLAAKWALGLRLINATEGDLDRAVAEKTIVPTWIMRGTLHFVAARDIRWILNVLAPRMIAGNARRYRELELDETTLARTNTILADALQDRKQLTRNELIAVLQQMGISTDGQRIAFMLQRAALDGLICRGATHGSDSTYMLIDDSFPRPNVLARDEALAELARRYFASRAPATLQDFIWWSGLNVSEARTALESIKSELAEAVIEGKTYWLPQTAPPIPAQKSPSAFLLAAFDEYMLSYQDRGAVLNPQYAERIVPGRNGIFNPITVIDGQIVGIWKRTFKKGAVIITSQPFEPLTDVQNLAVIHAAQHYGQFVQMPVIMPE